jgi:CubicO group peptidase (beta-lactamase class C family)
MTNAFTDDGLARFDEAVAREVGEVPGLVALVSCGDEVHVATAGSLSLGGPEVHRDSLWRIASTTKPITGAAVMALVGEGLLSLDEPVARLLPELAEPRVLRRMNGPLDDTVPAARPITVRDLMTFTFGSGMAMEMFIAPEPWPVVQALAKLGLGVVGPPDPAEKPDPDTWMAGLGSLPLMAQPGERWLYNGGTLVLGVLAARAAGVPFAEVLRNRIFEPLGMRDTDFSTSDTSRLATAYSASDGGLEVADPPDGKWSRPPAFDDGSAGLVSTVDDLAAFARMMLRGGDPILSPEAVAEMTRNHLTDEQRRGAEPILNDGRAGGRLGWGLCQAVTLDGPHAGAFGWDGGFGSSFLVDPGRDLFVTVQHQRLWRGPDDFALHRRVEEAVYAALR